MPTQSAPSSKVAILTGPTATGKTSIAIEFALKHGQMEIINADSMLVYRNMTIGTAKPTVEERQGIAHHLIDIRNPDEPFTAGEFTRLAKQTISEIHARGNRALIVGGTGFYLKALLFGQWAAPPADLSLRAEFEELDNSELAERLRERDPEAALRIGPSDRYRLVRALEIIQSTGETLTELQKRLPKDPDPLFSLLVIDRETEELFKRVEARTDAMLKAGLLAEVEKILQAYPTSRALKAVGYEQTVAYLKKHPPSGRKTRPGIQGLQDEIELATRQLVKRQRTWFRAQKCAAFFSLPSSELQLLQQLRSIYT